MGSIDGYVFTTEVWRSSRHELLAVCIKQPELLDDPTGICPAEDSGEIIVGQDQGWVQLQ